MFWLYIFGLLLGYHTVSSYRDCRELDFQESDSKSAIYNSITDFISTSDGKTCKIMLQDGLKTLSTGVLSTDPRAYYIRKIELSYNKIEVVEEDPFIKSGVCLVVLDLSHNNISIIKANAFTSLKYLQKLDLSYNNITTLNYTAFPAVNKIDFINLNNNKLKTVANMTFLNNVTVLQLANNQLELRPGMFINFLKLIDLDISGNNISYIPLGLFEGVPLLENLNLGNNQLDAFATGVFSGISNLKIFNLSLNLMPPIELTNEKVFLPISKIHTFILDGNTNLTDLNITKLSQIFTNLKFLGIGNLPWKCENLLKFVKECQRYRIDITKHVNLVLHEHNIHGVRCIEGPAYTTVDTPVSTVQPPQLVTAPTFDENNLEKIVSKMVEKIVNQQKVSNSSVTGIVCAIIFAILFVLMVVFVVFKDRILGWKRNSYGNGRTVTNYKNERVNPHLDEAESNLVLISQMS